MLLWRHYMTRTWTFENWETPHDHRSCLVVIANNSSVSLLHEYCKQKHIDVKLEDINEGQNKLGCKAILIRSNGDKRTFDANPPYLTLSDARHDAALLALEHLQSLADHSLALSALLAQLSVNERRATPPNASVLPILAKIQKAHEPLRDENGQALVESRHLEFKALNKPPLKMGTAV